MSHNTAGMRKYSTKEAFVRTAAGRLVTIKIHGDTEELLGLASRRKNGSLISDARGAKI